MSAIFTLPCADAPAPVRLVPEAMYEAAWAPNEPAVTLRAMVGSQEIARGTFFDGYGALDALEVPAGVALDEVDLEAVTREAEELIHEQTSMLVLGGIAPGLGLEWKDLDLKSAPFAPDTEASECGTHFIWHDGSQGGWAHAMESLAWARNPLNGAELWRYAEATRTWSRESFKGSWRVTTQGAAHSGFVFLELLDSRGAVIEDMDYGPDHFNGEQGFTPSFLQAEFARAPGAADAFAVARSIYRALAAGRVKPDAQVTWRAAAGE